MPPAEGGRPAVDLLTGSFYAEARPAYAWMRAHEPVFHDEANRLWAFATYDLVQAAGRDPGTFSNAGGSRPDTGPLPWMIDMDGTAHTKRRQLVSRGFTPARVRATEPHLRDICDTLIDRVVEQGECDFVADIAAPLPMIVIGDMLGVPVADRDQLLSWSRGMLASLSGDAEGYATAAAAFGAYVEYAHGVIDDRRVAPKDDLFSVLVNAEVDGDRLADDEIVFESLLLLIGGDETTRQVTAGGMEQLLRNARAKDALQRDPRLLPSAVEEMLRWTSPIKNMARTTTAAVELCGVEVPAAARVVVLYESANFDERHFTDPDAFDIERAPNDHIAFGFGPHFCLGASLARAELAAIVERVLVRLPGLRLASEDALPRSITGIQRMPVAF